MCFRGSYDGTDWLKVLFHNGVPILINMYDIYIHFFPSDGVGTNIIFEEQG